MSAYHINLVNLFIQEIILLSFVNRIQHIKIYKIYKNISLLKASLRQHLKTIQYVYSLLFPKIYNRTNKFRINNKSHFDFVFNNWKHNKNFANIQLPKRIGKQQHAQQQNKMKLEKRLKVPKKRFHIHLNKNHKKSN